MKSIVGLALLLVACDPPTHEERMRAQHSDEQNEAERRAYDDAHPSHAKRVLIAEGYEDIRMTGAAIMGCSEDDSMLASETFEATRVGANGTRRHVSGQVCCGLVFKGCTVRFE